MVHENRLSVLRARIKNLQAWRTAPPPVLLGLSRMYIYLNSANPILWGGDHNVTTNPRLDRYPSRIDGDVGRGAGISWI